MTSPELPHFEDISIYLEIEVVTRELSILDETIHACRGLLAKRLFERTKMELLRDPSAYMTKQVETAKLTWQHQPALAKFMYLENDND